MVDYEQDKQVLTVLNIDDAYGMYLSLELNFQSNTDKICQYQFIGQYFV